MHILVDRLMPLMTSETAQPTHGAAAGRRADVAGHHTVVFHARLDERTGRFERR